MDLILIYYNPIKNNFYMKIISVHPSLTVGYVNSYDHLLVDMMTIENKKLIHIDNYWSHYRKKSIQEYKKRRFTLKNRLINRAIYLLNKLR